MAAGHLIIQSDWNSSLRDNNGSAWIIFKKQSTKSVYGDLKSHGVASNNLPYVTASEDFSVSNINGNTITVGYAVEGEHCKCRFQAPVVTFSSIHSKAKSVLCLDVTRGGLAVSCDTDKKLLVWETESGEIRRRLDGHFADVYTCRFFPSGVVILSGGADMQLKIWSAESGSCAATLKGHTQAITDTAIIERGRNIVSCSKDGTAKLWDCGKQACIATFDVLGGIINACALQSVSSEINLGVPSNQSNEGEVLTEGKLLMVACENGSLKGFGLHSRKKIFDIALDSAANTCAFHNENEMVVGTQDGKIIIYDIRNHGEPIANKILGRGPILSCLSTSKGFMFSSGDGSASLLNSQYDVICNLTGPDCEPVYNIVSNGSHYYTACRDGSIRKYSNLV